MTDLLNLSSALRTSRGTLLASALSGGALRLYGGTQPASADTALSGQPLLASFELPSPAASCANAVLTGAAIAPVLVLETGTAAWARMLDADGVAVADCSCGTLGAGAAITLDNLALVAGGMVSVISFSVSEP